MQIPFRSRYALGAWLLLLALGASACDGSEEPGADAGADGAVDDAGVAELDGGDVDVDAGEVDVDAGEVDVDAGAPECETAADCGDDTECLTFACEGGACVETDRPAGTACTDGGEVCDGAGACVAATCDDGLLDGDETDVDCGGPECSACENGESCASGDDCVSGACDGSTCGACVDDADCNATGDLYCAAGSCTERRAQGASCAEARECASGHCIDGVCCDTACGAGAGGDCRVCDLAGAVGTCSPEPSGTSCGDPTDGECTEPNTCDGAGTCLANDEIAGTACGDQGVECLVDDTCDGAGSCVDNGFEGAGVACGDPTDSECANPDACDGAGVCLANDPIAGSACGDQGVECLLDDGCDGAGNCVDNGFAAAASPCGDSLDDDCTDADTCDGSGACLPNHEPASTSCTSDGLFCTGVEACDGAGACASDGDPCASSLRCDEAAAMCVPRVPWINEIHYDNASTDVDEMVEVAVPAAYDISALSVFKYNGSSGEVYGFDSLSSFTVGATVGGITLYYVSYPSNGLQNGSPDGLALDDGGTVLAFLSYEGTFVATDGPAAGMTSTDIGVAESGAVTAGTSLSLQGTGTGYSDFTWVAEVAATPGTENTGQTIN